MYICIYIYIYYIYKYSHVFTFFDGVKVENSKVINYALKLLL